MKKPYLVVLTRVHSEHSNLKEAKQAMASIKLKKGELAVMITPEGKRHEKK